ncbi:hypothetical protein QUF49_20295 [Fictibacillus sp. b24]|uniref:hypothetical protein n=1 Tax=Fictibacillus sp. b24 TaxID=3055863 RepID=UPI0025A1A1C3|nr:hypothetical protein [Fictibacillus sp. b24]MDM5318327.1 hypothetical protein [Fictibacillus sp. b24]
MGFAKILKWKELASFRNELGLSIPVNVRIGGSKASIELTSFESVQLSVKDDQEVLYDWTYHQGKLNEFINAYDNFKIQWDIDYTEEELKKLLIKYNELRKSLFSGKMDTDKPDYSFFHFAWDLDKHIKKHIWDSEEFKDHIGVGSGIRNDSFQIRYYVTRDSYTLNVDFDDNGIYIVTMEPPYEFPTYLRHKPEKDPELVKAQERDKAILMNLTHFLKPLLDNYQWVKQEDEDESYIIDLEDESSISESSTY